MYVGYSESNLQWAVNKTSNDKKIIMYQTNTYILKLLLNVVNAGIQALVISGNKFCVPVSKKSAARELSHVLTPSNNFSLLLKCYASNQFLRQVNGC
jgi:hypothetical protein